MSELDPDACYRALSTRDERFDGRLFVGVTSTGIYCRPVCPAGPAKRENCRFFPSAAAAQEAGFRPCLRCRPELAPDAGSWRGTSCTVSRALTLIAAGALDGDDASVDALAERLGVGERQLRRLFQRHLGTSPIAVAQTRRVLFAKQLIHDTRLPMAEVALASGFGSVRRFNETFQQLFRRPPSALRRKGSALAQARQDGGVCERGARAGGRSPPEEMLELPEGTLAASGVTVRLRYRAPYDWVAMLSHLRARAVDGVEQVDGAVYRRTFAHGGTTGTVEIAHQPEARSLAATIRLSSVRALPAIVARIRRAFDLGADVTAIGEHLARDPLLAAPIAARPGLRVPGGWDGFELAARAILGQQVSVEAGRRLLGQLARACGTHLPASPSAAPLPRLVFPSAEQVARADLGVVRAPLARRQALSAMAQAALEDPRLFEPLATLEQTVERLRSIRGVGEWTAQYIALRAAREPDAFPASDVALLRGARGHGARPSPRALEARAERWRPRGAAPRTRAIDTRGVPMTPTSLLIDHTETPIGRLALVADEDGRLHAAGFTEGHARLERLLRERTLTPSANPGGLTAALRAYFAGDLGAIDDLPVACVGTDFQKAVWHALREIPCGETRSYAELARRIGNPAAVRAVGLANGANPVGVVVPCHRVVGSNGSLTGYGGGIERKRWLLDHELAGALKPACERPGAARGR